MWRESLDIVIFSRGTWPVLVSWRGGGENACREEARRIDLSTHSSPSISTDTRAVDLPNWKLEGKVVD